MSKELEMLIAKVQGLEKALAKIQGGSNTEKTEFTYDEAAQFLGVSTGTVRILKEKGVLPSYEVFTGGTIRKKVRFKREDLERVKEVKQPDLQPLT